MMMTTLTTLTVCCASFIYLRMLNFKSDVLASFNKPAQSSASTSTREAAVPPKSSTLNHSSGDDDEDFEASLADGMESLLRQLAGDHPPGPMPDLPPSSSSALDPSNSTPLGELSPEEEEKAWQKALEMMLSGEGLEALGIAPNSPAPPLPSSSAPRPQQADKPDFDETIRRTMESLRSPASSSSIPPAGGPDLSALLSQLGIDGDGGEGDDDISGLLDGMMAQLMTKEVLEEPMGELAAKYPAYLADPPKDISKEDMDKYRKQSDLVKRIVAIFGKSGYSDAQDGKEVARLVGEMQDLGGPPKEVMGDLPEGFVSH
jgi:peroxin-19